MIPRYQRILFWSLAAAIVLVAAFLFHAHRQTLRRLAAPADETPIAAPGATSTQDVTLYLANDADGTVAPSQASLALPDDPTSRARTLLDHLLSSYAQPGSAHPLQSGPAVEDVFLVPNTPSTDTHSTDKTETAIVNLTSTFCDRHPSGILVETLTIRSIVQTLHADFPRVTAVRFLVDGQPRETLAGHADLTRTYSATTENQQPTAGN
ncbi:GerMN domain-containing protein [Edaphobacter sp.]|uniref:GerMN domain-containing protein n=1 Tax=Edaphobacter sp. TaxID=1934404 RepID=UPI002DBFE901|nr:GerMN domain-containing protein [Edaphobacter sp.]HEU5341228.1 GerMN domain-containing protein [Edaphobacter sp.]